MNGEAPRLSVIIPSYCDGRLIAESVGLIKRALATMTDSWQIVIVDDASPDGSATTIRAFVETEADARITARYHKTNTGRGGAVRTGMRDANGTVVGFVDVDLEVNEWAILACTSAVEGGADCATIHRFYRIRPRSFGRVILSRGYSFLVQRLLHLGLHDTETGCKFFDRDSVLPLLNQTTDTGWFWDTEIMALAVQSRQKIVEIPWLYARRPGKASTVRGIRDSAQYFIKLWRGRARLRVNP